MSLGAKVFIKIDDYKDIIDIIDLIKEKIDEANVVIGRLNELKNQEESELNLCTSTINSVKSKTDYIDQTLFQENIK